MEGRPSDLLGGKGDLLRLAASLIIDGVRKNESIDMVGKDKARPGTRACLWGRDDISPGLRMMADGTVKFAAKPIVDHNNSSIRSQIRHVLKCKAGCLEVLAEKMDGGFERLQQLRTRSKSSQGRVIANPSNA